MKKKNEQNSSVKAWIKQLSYQEADEKFLGGSLDSSGQEGDGLDGLLSADLSLQDAVTDDNKGGVGSGQNQSIDQNLAVFSIRDS